MKFSIRELLLVMMVVAIALGWWVDRRALRREIRDRIQDARTWKDLYDERKAPSPSFPNSSAPAPNQPKKVSGNT